MQRSELIKRRNKSWDNVNFLRDLQEQTKSKAKSIEYQELIRKEKFKYKIYNTLLKRNDC